MEGIKIILQYWEQLKRLFVYSQYCTENDIHIPVCHDFWFWGSISVISVGVLIVLFCCKTIIKDQIEYYKNRKHLEARAIVADAETMEKHKWKGDDADVPLAEEELAKEIRKAAMAKQSI